MSYVLVNKLYLQLVCKLFKDEGYVILSHKTPDFMLSQFLIKIKMLLQKLIKLFSHDF